MRPFILSAIVTVFLVMLSLPSSAQTTAPTAPGTETIYRCTAQPFGAPPVCTKTGLAQLAASGSELSRIYKCVHRPDGGLNCSTVVLGQLTTPAELTAVMQTALTGLDTSILDPNGNVEINAHGHSANCHIIGHSGGTVYIECDSVVTRELPLSEAYVSGDGVTNAEGCVPTICKCRCPRTTPAL